MFLSGQAHAAGAPRTNALSIDGERPVFIVFIPIATWIPPVQQQRRKAVYGSSALRRWQLTASQNSIASSANARPASLA